ncbi:MAG TPA: sulfatase-like hydrolase/transferase, partial [Methylocystis sp.]
MPTRRDVLSSATTMLTATLTPAFAGSADAAQKQKVSGPAVQRLRSKRPNILFIFTDQERYCPKWPSGLSLPAHEALQRRGVTFKKHYCPATMCTSSRSVMMTGLTTPDNGMFENTDAPYIG